MAYYYSDFCVDKRVNSHTTVDNPGTRVLIVVVLQYTQKSQMCHWQKTIVCHPDSPHTTPFAKSTVVHCSSFLRNLIRPESATPSCWPHVRRLLFSTQLTGTNGTNRYNTNRTTTGERIPWFVTMSLWRGGQGRNHLRGGDRKRISSVYRFEWIG